MSPMIGDQEYEDAKRLARSDDVNARRKLALRADMRPEILYYLAEDKALEVRRAIAGNAGRRSDELEPSDLLAHQAAAVDYSSPSSPPLPSRPCRFSRSRR